MEKWVECGVAVEGVLIRVEGVNPWDHDWGPRKGTVTLPHPTHPQQRHEYDVYEIDCGGKRITFAAGELSANVWGFYVPQATPARP